LPEKEGLSLNAAQISLSVQKGKKNHLFNG